VIRRGVGSRRRWLAWLGAVLCSTILSSAACSSRSTLTGALSDQDFRALIDTLSEPPGSFTISENLVSNEPRFAENIRWLGPGGGVYVGVGPEQNFSYIARLQPSLAFIVDIRRENRNLHLLYKALFELSTDRADFLSRLFSRPKPRDLESTASVERLFTAYADVRPSPETYGQNAALVRARLLTTHALQLTEADLDGIDRAFRAFYTDGPDIQFWGARTVDAVRPSYRQLMTSRDLLGQTRSFLASEDAFQVVKDLQTRNLIVPVVGDFGGPRTIRAIGDYVRTHKDSVRAFYGSNVSVYLNTQQTRTFCASLAALPAARDAWFVDSDSVRSLASKVKACGARIK
jgi:hypothetical protein